MSTSHQADLITAAAAKAVSTKVRLQPRINIKNVIDCSRSLARSVVLDFKITELDGFV
jgi:hypothetical protein